MNRSDLDWGERAGPVGNNQDIVRRLATRSLDRGRESTALLGYIVKSPSVGTSERDEMSDTGKENNECLRHGDGGPL